MPQPLSESLPGTWRLLSRIDVNAIGARVEEPSLGADPVALLIYDRAGNFAAQFMKRDRSAGELLETKVAGTNNTRAKGGYDAYFGAYSVDDATGLVTQTLVGALSVESIGLQITRALRVQGDRLVIQLETTAVGGEPVTRTLTWERVG